MNGKFNPRVDSFRDLKIKRTRQNHSNQQQHDILKAFTLNSTSGKDQKQNGVNHNDDINGANSKDDIYVSAVCPLETQSGVKKYTCQKCIGGLTFDMYDGPYGAREHVRQVHS